MKAPKAEAMKAAEQPAKQAPNAPKVKAKAKVKAAIVTTTTFARVRHAGNSQRKFLLLVKVALAITILTGKTTMLFVACSFVFLLLQTKLPRASRDGHGARCAARRAEPF